MNVRRAVVAGGLAVVLVLLAGCGGDDDKDDAADGGSGAAAAVVVHKIGETVKLGNVEVTVHGVQDPFDSGNPVVKAPAGSRQLAVEVEVKNLSSKPQVFSAFSQFDLKDATSKTFVAVPVPRNVASFGGDAPPGGAQRGLLAYQIPEGSTGLQLVFKNPLVTEGSVTYALT